MSSLKQLLFHFPFQCYRWLRPILGLQMLYSPEMNQALFTCLMPIAVEFVCLKPQSIKLLLVEEILTIWDVESPDWIDFDKLPIHLVEHFFHQST